MQKIIGELVSPKKRRGTLFLLPLDLFSQKQKEESDRLLALHFFPLRMRAPPFPRKNTRKSFFFAGKATTVYRGEGGKLSNMQRGSLPPPPLFSFFFSFFGESPGWPEIFMRETARCISPFFLSSSRRYIKGKEEVEEWKKGTRDEG